MRSSPTHVPLARNAEGPIEVPESAAHWRVRRHTGGRPRLVLGVDKQPLKLPLAMTEADLEDILGPATYRLDLCDQTGNQLETVTITIGEQAEPEAAKPAAAAEPPESALAFPLPSTNHEMRLVLEANIRAMTASFQHNERTLSTSLRMAETLRDGVRVLADAQADWIKSIAGAKGYLRNAAAAPPPQLPPPMLPPPPEDEIEEDDDEEDEDVPPPWQDSIAKTVSEVVPPLAMMFMQHKAASGSEPAGEPKPSFGERVMDTLSGAIDWRKAAAQGARGKDASADARPAANANQAVSKPITMATIAQRAPDLVPRMARVIQRISPTDRERLHRLVSLITETELPAIAEQIRRVPDEQLAEYLLKVAGGIEDAQRADATTNATKE